MNTTPTGPRLVDRTTLLLHARKWSSILKNGGVGWLTAPLEVPKILDDLIVEVEASAPPVAIQAAESLMKELDEDERRGCGFGAEVRDAREALRKALS